MADVKVLGKLAGLEPDEGGGHAFEHEARDPLPFGDGKATAVGGHDHVQKVLLALELVAKGAEGAGELVRLQADVDEGEPVIGARDGGVEVGQGDAPVLLDVPEDASDDLVAPVPFGFRRDHRRGGWRSRRDSNSRAIADYTISNRAPSTTRTRLLANGHYSPLSLAFAGKTDEVALPLLLALSIPSPAAALDASFVSVRPEAKAPAVAAALLMDGHAVWSKADGFMDLAKTQRATPDSKFRIASLTKAFTATIVLQLVSEGKVALDDPIAKGLPDLPAAWKGVTVRQLLNHTSGVPSPTEVPDSLERLDVPQTPAQIIGQAADKPLDFPPGTQFRYSNMGYVVLGALIERLDGRPLARALQARILKPLRMSNTRLDEGGRGLVSEGFDGDGKPAQAIDMALPYAAGGIVSTANDMAKWLAAQGSKRLLPQRLWEEAWKPGVRADGTPTQYGFGWELGEINGVPTIEHDGSIPGFTTLVKRVPAKSLSVVVLTNADDANPWTVADRLLNTADPSLKDADTAVPDPDVKVTEATQKLLEGLKAGVPDRSMLSPGLAPKFSFEAVQIVRGFLASLGRLQELRLVKVKGAKRTYLAHYEKLTIKVRVSQDDALRFTDFSLRPD